MDAFEIDEGSSIPIWVQLKNRIVFLIRSGHYQPGDRLPTVRELATSLKINYNTVNKVYLNLLHEGYLRSVRGRGTFVAENAASLLAEESPTDNIIDLMIKRCLDEGVPLDDIVGQVAARVELLKSEAAD